MYSAQIHVTEALVTNQEQIQQLIKLRCISSNLNLNKIYTASEFFISCFNSLKTLVTNS